jgi:hypothetical protein
MATQKSSRPLILYLLGLILVLLSLAALGGGVLLVSDPTGAAIGLPSEWLAGSLFPNYLIPGLFLFLVIGLGSLLVLVALWMRPKSAPLADLTRWTHEHWAWAADVAFGIVVALWIVIQYLVIQRFHPLQAVIFSVGIIIAALALLPGMRRYYSR